jgi:hypothetical protein
MHKHDVFLSHNGADKTWTEKLASDIESNLDGNKLKVFFDKWDITPGDDVPVELEKALTESRHVALVMTPEAFKSEWVSLEVSTTIYSDPSARKRKIIPLLRRPCEPPLTIRRINRIDFTDDSNYQNSLEILLATLRGKPLPRGKSIPLELIEENDDRSLLERHKQAFERPAFRIPCIWELFLKELTQAIDQTQAAINTGKLYTREGHLIDNYQGARHFKTALFKDAFKKVELELTKLKYFVSDFEHFFKKQFPDYDHHTNFYSMFMMAVNKGNPAVIKQMVADMDKIDIKRNEILTILNQLPGNSTFDLMEPSSEILKKGQMGGSRIREYLE